VFSEEERRGRRLVGIVGHTIGSIDTGLSLISTRGSALMPPAFNVQETCYAFQFSKPTPNRDKTRLTSLLLIHVIYASSYPGCKHDLSLFDHILSKIPNIPRIHTHRPRNNHPREYNSSDPCPKRQTSLVLEERQPPS
jgi:hypothetical protein